MKNLFVKFHWLLQSNLGIDLLRLARSLRGAPLFLRDWIRFRKAYVGPLSWMPCLHDRYEEGGATKSEYFWQDLLVARWVSESRPRRHVDVGSRVDGFVAHVAAFREIEVFDVRPITTEVPGIVFRQADLMDPASIQAYAESGGYCDSLSCLHALEHFGLGRYGDPVNPKGYELGLANLARLLEPGGVLYLSTPIGEERVEFNANWVFDPVTVLRTAEANDLMFRRMCLVRAGHDVAVVPVTADALPSLATERYNLGVFVFQKKLTPQGR